MASGKKSREARRAAAAKPPPVQSKGGTRSRQASPKVLGAAAGLVILIVIGVVLGVVLTGGNKSSTPTDVPSVGSIEGGLPGSADVAALYKGIPQKNLVLGSAFAPVTMTEFIDLQCPICQEFETQVFPDIVQKYIRTKKVKVVVEPWAFIGNDSFRGQDLMLAAEKQSKAFNFEEVLYANQGTENTGWLTDDMLYNIAVSVPGMKIRPLFAERGSTFVKKDAAAIAADAKKMKVSGTPTLFVNRTGQKPVEVPLTSGQDETTLTQYLDKALSGT